MTWRLTEWAKTRSPLNGVPWRDLSDEEFAAAESRFPKGVLREQGYFEEGASDEPATRQRSRRRAQSDESGGS